MPKSGNPRNQSYAYKQDGKVISANHNKGGKQEEGIKRARIRVGDSNLKLLDGAKDSEPVYPDSDTLQKKAVSEAKKYERRKGFEKSKALHLKEGKARIKDDFGDVINMVKEKKSTIRFDY